MTAPSTVPIPIQGPWKPRPTPHVKFAQLDDICDTARAPLFSPEHVAAAAEVPEEDDDPSGCPLVLIGGALAISLDVDGDGRMPAHGVRLLAHLVNGLSVVAGRSLLARAIDAGSVTLVGRGLLMTLPGIEVAR